MATVYGPWCKTNLVVNPSCSLTLRQYNPEDPHGRHTQQVLSVTFDCGYGWRATWRCEWRLQPMPPFQTELYQYWRLGYWWATEEWFVEHESITSPAPDSATTEFSAWFNGIIIQKRGLENAVRGDAGIQHPDELDIEYRYLAEADSVTTTATFGPLSGYRGIGQAFGDDVSFDNPTLSLDYARESVNEGYGSGVFNDIKINGDDAPCYGLDNPHEYGSGNSIYVGQNNPPASPDGGWSGWIWPPYKVHYYGMPVHMWDDDYTTAQIRDALYSMHNHDENELFGDPLWAGDFDGKSWEIWNRSWGAYPEDYDDFTSDPTLWFNLHPAWLLGTLEKNLDDRIVCDEYPLDNFDPADGRFKAIVWDHKPELEVHYPDGHQPTPWVGSTGIDVTNDGATTYIEAFGPGYVERTLRSYYFTRLDFNPDEGPPYPWDYVDWKFHNGETYEGSGIYYTDEDVFNYSNYSYLVINMKANWSGSALSRDWYFQIYYYDLTINDNHLTGGRDFSYSVTPRVVTYTISVDYDERSTSVDKVIDLAFPAEKYLPRLYHVYKLRISNLVNGDTIQFNSIKLTRYNPATNKFGEDTNSVEMGIVFPDSYPGDEDDHFSVATTVDGVLTFDRSTDNVGQNGVEKGLPHVYYLEGAASGLDLSTEQTLDDFAEQLSRQEGFSAQKVASISDNGGPLKDSDGNSLQPEYWCLLQETVGTQGTTLYACPKARTIKLAAGMTYYARPRKILRGGIQGLAYYGDNEQRARANLRVNAYRCEDDAKGDILEDYAITNEWGHFIVRRLYETQTYALLGAGDPTACLDIRNVETNWRNVPVSGISNPVLVQLREGPVVLFYLSGGDIWSVMQTTPPLDFSNSMQHTTYGDVQNIDAIATNDGKICVAFDRGGTIYFLFLESASRRTIGGIKTVKENWTKPALLDHMGILFLAGIDDPDVKLTRLHSYGSGQLPFSDGSYDRTIVDGEDVDIIGLSGYGNYLEVAVQTAGGIAIYCSADLGETWVQKQVVT